jgi:hypothetical protein
VTTYLGRVDLSSERILDLVSRCSEASLALNDTYSQAYQRALEVSLDAVSQVLGMSGNAFTVVLDGSLDIDSERSQVLRVAHFADTSRRGEQSLGGNAAAVDASATDVPAGKDSSLEVLGPSMQGSPVTAYTASDDSHVKVVRERIVGRHAQERRCASRACGHRLESLGGRQEERKAKEDSHLVVSKIWKRGSTRLELAGSSCARTTTTCFHDVGNFDVVAFVGLIITSSE